MDHLSTSAHAETIEREALLAVLNHLEIGLGLYGERGELLFRSRSMSRLLARAQGIAHAVERLVEDLVGRAQERAWPTSMQIERLEQREIRSDGLRCRLRGSHIGLDLCGTGATLLVTIEHVAEVALPPGVMGKRFGLTTAQMRVALLVAEGMSNAEIAAELHVSVNTTRNHVQQVLQKLGTHSRSRVGPLLRGTETSER